MPRRKSPSLCGQEKTVEVGERKEDSLVILLFCEMESHLNAQHRNYLKAHWSTTWVKWVRLEYT